MGDGGVLGGVHDQERELPGHGRAARAHRPPPRHRWRWWPVVRGHRDARRLHGRAHQAAADRPRRSSPFPTGTATAETLHALHGEGSEAGRRGRGSSGGPPPSAPRWPSSADLRWLAVPRAGVDGAALHRPRTPRGAVDAERGLERAAHRRRCAARVPHRLVDALRRAPQLLRARAMDARPRCLRNRQLPFAPGLVAVARSGADEHRRGAARLRRLPVALGAAGAVEPPRRLPGRGAGARGIEEPDRGGGGPALLVRPRLPRARANHGRADGFPLRLLSGPRCSRFRSR